MNLSLPYLGIAVASGLMYQSRAGVQLALDLSTAAHVAGAIGGATAVDYVLDMAMGDSAVRSDSSSSNVLSSSAGQSVMTIIEAIAGGAGGAMLVHKFM